MNIAMMQRFKQMEREILELQAQVKALQEHSAVSIPPIIQPKPRGRPRKNA